MPFAIRAAALLSVCLACLGAQPLPKFLGRQVTIIKPEMDPDGFFPKGPASVCLEAPPERQCYTAPKDYGRDPQVEMMQVEGKPALFFTVSSGGVSGFVLHFALLRPGDGKDLDDLFSLADADVSNLSQHAFWTDPSISDAPIFVTANYILGPDESHYDLHRYMISAYVLKHTSVLIEGSSYYLEDSYMTVHKYDYEKDDILAAEKPEILARLKRVKAAESAK